MATATGRGTKSTEPLTFGVFGPKGGAKRMVLDGLRKHGVTKHGGSGALSLLPLKGAGCSLVLVDRAGRLEKGSSMTKGMDPAAELAHQTCELLRGPRNVTQIEEPKEAVASLLARTPKESLMRTFALPQFEDVESFLTILGKDKDWKSKRGRLLEPERVALKFLTELGDQTKGGFPYVCAPPTTEKVLELEKGHWSKAPGGGASLLTHAEIKPILEEQHGAFSNAEDAAVAGPAHLEMMSISPSFDFPAELGEDSESSDEEDEMSDGDEEDEDDEEGDGEDDEDYEEMSDGEEEGDDDDDEDEDEDDEEV